MSDLTNKPIATFVAIGIALMLGHLLLRCASAPAPLEVEASKETPAPVTDQAVIEEQQQDDLTMESTSVEDFDEDRPEPMTQPEPQDDSEAEHVEETDRGEEIEHGQKRRENREIEPWSDRYQAILRINELTRSIRNAKSDQRYDTGIDGCRDICELSDSICYSAREICDIANHFPEEPEFRERCDWAADECVSSQDLCRSCR